MRSKTFRFILFALAGIFAAVATGMFLIWVYKARYTLTVAAGPAEGYGQRFVAALNEAFKPEEPRMRFRYLATADAEGSAQALEQGKADLAILRSDVKPPSNGLVVVILRRDAIGLLVPADSKIKGFADLANKRVGILPGPHYNQELFQALASFHGVDPKTIKQTTVEITAIPDAIKNKSIDVVFGIGPIGFGPLENAVAAMRRAAPRDKPPVFLTVENASGFVKAHPAMETIDVPKGAFGGATAIPDDDETTLALTWRLVAKDRMLDAVAGELARMLIVSKPRLERLMPGTQQIIAPDTDDKSPYLPLHPGAAAYFNDDEESWFDRFQDIFYLVLMGGSVVASAFAAAVGFFRRRKHRESDLQRLAKLMHTISTQKDYDPDKATAELESIVSGAVAYRADHVEDLDSPEMLQLALAEIRRLIEDRRRELATNTPTS